MPCSINLERKRSTGSWNENLRIVPIHKHTGKNERDDQPRIKKNLPDYAKKEVKNSCH